MNLNQMEMERENVFKDAVLNAAEAKAMEIVAEAAQKREAEIRRAHLRIKETDHNLMEANMKRKAEREFSAIAQQAKKELLEHRAQLVNSLFADVEAKLEAFVQSDAYPEFLCARLQQHTSDFDPAISLTVYLRAQDMEHAKMLKKVVPGCSVQENRDIRFGGLKVADGHRLYDETLDAALEAEREAFYASGELML